MRQVRTFVLMAALVAVFGALGLLIGGRVGLLLALAVASTMNLYAYWNSDTVVLRMHQARQVGPEHSLYRIVEPLAARAGLPMPGIWLIEQPQPNAFATGRNPGHAAVAATTGLLERLDQAEIAAVMAHELAHVKNRDTLLMTMTATLAGAISLLGSYALFAGGHRGERAHPLLLLLAMVVAPFAAGLVQMAISRTREYEADRIGAGISGQPLKLASALQKLQHAANRIPNPVAERNPAAAALYIVESKGAKVRDHLFGTHPATENRIAALMGIAGMAGDRMKDGGMNDGGASPPHLPGALGLGRTDRPATPASRGRSNPWA